jgi:hypothetical protein
MNKIYAIYIILSSKDNDLYMLSTEEKDLSPPLVEIQTPSKIKQESRYILRNFFTVDSYKFTEECSYNFLDIQEENSIDYLKSINKHEDTDLYITYGGIAPLNKLNKNLYWNKLIFNNEYFGYSNNKPLNLAIDNVINKASL